MAPAASPPPLSHSRRRRAQLRRAAGWLAAAGALAALWAGLFWLPSAHAQQQSTNRPAARRAARRTPTPTATPRSKRTPAPAPKPSPKSIPKPTPAAAPVEVDVPKNARTPEELNRQAEEYAKLGYYDLALSAHLQAARTSGNADTLARQARALLEARQAACQAYFEAMLEHFPGHAQMQDLIRLRVALPVSRDRGWGTPSFYAPNFVDAYLAGETAFERVATAPAVRPDDRLRAAVGAIDCHYRAGPRSPELREEARKKYNAVLARIDEKQTANEPWKSIVEHLRKKIAALDNSTEWTDPNIVRKDETLQ